MIITKYRFFRKAEKYGFLRERRKSMDFLVKFASAFMGVFQLGGEQFMGWVTGIIPTILMLLVMMNAIIALIGDERIEVIAKVCTSNPLLRYAVLPWLSAFMLAG